ncbi:MAG: hypothetical protein J1E82_01790 [Muribaculaceae bacterium]|nr:hypothetical protein [Muribaculaceae bacterium]
MMIKCIRKATFALLLMLPFSSCISENETEPAPQIPEETENVLRVMIPRYLDFESETKTKADNDVEVPASKEEATVDKLWFFAYPVAGSDNSEAQTFIKEISDEKTSQVETDNSAPNTDYTGYEDYAAYDVKGIRKGTYHIYVVANLEKYISQTTELKGISEENLQKLVLYFGTDTYSTINASEIPMACYYTDICKKTGSGDPTKVTSGEFTFNGNANEVLYADMTMLCSKVRYTILFDMDTFSDTFPENTVDFNSAVPITNICPSTSLAPSTTSPTTDLLTSNGVLSPVYYPGDTEKYPSGNHTDWYLNITQEREGEVKAPENLTKITSGSWTNLDKRAWQGIIYLPENLAIEPTGEAADNRTTLSFTPTAESNVPDNKQVALTLKRGNFYDVVGKLQTPLRIEFYISVKIQILAWAKRNIYVGW